MRSFTANPLFVTALNSEPGEKSLFSLGPFIKPPWIPTDFSRFQGGYIVQLQSFYKSDESSWSIRANTMSYPSFP